ncbi:hypothetical protein VHEMI03695 [[Torrubiella] hemipterigena]|uniref:Uncharacterized protein n=1 Tax=[Torrubiella] hemipterigena TaxID=1531966 RepID=A0A0A1TE75_9HYPO|nr:hypothetical protein VHEMI03695 [[Torrubiella] hemipterigena]
MTDKPRRPFESYVGSKKNFGSVAFRRIQWKFTANESAVDSVHVLRDITDANSGLVPFFNEDGTTHRVATASITCYVSPDEDDDDDEDDEDEEPEDDWFRFYRGPRLEVKPKAGDYITAVHPWLHEKRQLIISPQ